MSGLSFLLLIAILGFVQLCHLYEGNAMCRCDSVWILKPLCHNEVSLFRVN